MIQSYSRGRFEYFVVATVIALVALVALDRYTLMIKDARVLRLEIISHHFMTAAANMRVEFLLSHVTKPSMQVQNGLLVDGRLVYVSEQGWPASVTTPVATDFQPADSDCYQLWQLLLQNPAPITIGQFTAKPYKYRTFAQLDRCRYSLDEGDAYFDYFPVTGRLLFSAINN